MSKAIWYILQTISAAGGGQKHTLIHEKTYRKFTLVPARLRVYSLCTVDCKTSKTSTVITNITNSLLHFQVTN